MTGYSTSSTVTTFHKIGLKTPVVNPWTSVNDSHNPVWKTTANPYFWFVDSAGNQQPYIEDQRWLGVKGGELMNLKFMAGEATMASRHKYRQTRFVHDKQRQTRL